MPASVRRLRRAGRRRLPLCVTDRVARDVAQVLKALTGYCSPLLVHLQVDRTVSALVDLLLTAVDELNLSAGSRGVGRVSAVRRRALCA